MLIKKKTLPEILKYKHSEVGITLPYGEKRDPVVYRPELIQSRLELTYIMIEKLEDFIKTHSIDIEKLNKKMIAYEAIGSAGIEGYRIIMSSDKETAEFLEVGKYGRHLEKNRLCIVNNYKSLSKLLESKEGIKNIDELISYWRIILGNNIFHRNIRKVKVVVGSRNNIVHIAPKPREIRGLLKEMFNCLSNIEDKLLKSIIAHYIFVYIHPFIDGNGRTTRLFQQSILLNEVSHIVIPYSYAINRERETYYSGLQLGKWHNVLDMTEFVLDMLYYIDLGLQRVAEEVGYEAKELDFNYYLNKIDKIEDLDTRFNTDCTTWLDKDILAELFLNNNISEFQDLGYELTYNTREDI